MKEKIALIVDSAMDVPKEITAQEDVFELPLMVNYKDAHYRDKIDITSQEVFDNLEVEIPTTSLPSLTFINDTIETIKKEGYTHIICLTISSALSGTFNAVRLILEDHPEIPSLIIDTKNIGLGAGILGAYTNKLIKKGMTFESLSQKLQRLPIQGHIFFSIPTLEYLRKGGRIGHVASFLGTALNLQPIVSCDDEGVYYTVTKARGRKKSLRKLIETAVEQVGNHTDYSLAVSYGTCKEEAEEMIKTLKERLPHFEDFYTSEVSPVLGVHSGPGIIGIGVLLPSS